MDRIKETELHIINFDKGTVWSKLKNREIGSIGKNGYIYLNFYRKRIRIHRYIYEQYHNIKLTPKQIINHINHNITDNRIDNLNMVDNQRNCQYSKKPSHNTSGLKGVRWCNNRKKWLCRINVNQKFFHIKFCDTKEEANKLYNEVCRYLNKLGFYYYIEGEEVILQEDNRHLFNEEYLINFIKNIGNRKRGFGCVYFYEKKKKWIGQYKKKYIGSFNTKEEAQNKVNEFIKTIK